MIRLSEREICMNTVQRFLPFGCRLRASTVRLPAMAEGAELDDLTGWILLTRPDLPSDSNGVAH